LSHCIDGWMDGLIEELLIVMKENKFKVLKFIRKKKPHVNLTRRQPPGRQPPGRQPPRGVSPPGAQPL